MKIEYAFSTIGGGIDMLISVADFKNAGKDKTQFSLLTYAIDTFISSQGAYDWDFCEEPYNAIITRLPTSGNIIFVIKESQRLRYNPPKWCEIYTISNNTLRNILYSDDDGQNLYFQESEASQK